MADAIIPPLCQLPLLLMLPLSKSLQIFALSIVIIGATINRPGWGDEQPVDNPILSESLCQKVFTEAVSKFRAGNRQLSAQDRRIFQQCRDKFAPPPDPNASLPSATECVSLFKAVLRVEGDLNKLSETDVRQDRLLSMERCGEVVKTYYMSAGSMLPTLQINDRIIIDKTAYKDRAPQRGDIIIFTPNQRLRQENFKDPFVKRIIGLPGELVKIKNGKVYINGKAPKENYISESPKYEYQSPLIPANSYFVLGDNRNNSYDSHYWGFVPRNLIIGKLIWKFGDK
jgi:signal peptidase I